jgi:hypothetical protein
VTHQQQPDHHHRLHEEMERSTFLRWILTGASSAGDAGSAVYGTIVAASVLLASNDGPLTTILAMLAAGTVFWLAHAHVALIRDLVGGQRRITGTRVAATLTSEWPIVQATFLPAAPLALAVFGLISFDTSRWLAIVVCLVGLVAWGIVLARTARLSRRYTIVVVTINVLLGLLIVILKVLIH